ncbi:MAG: hypothetical protein BJ554DRAFT_6331 [Olpidium bornovanus]|uniref:Uncharacterized protein n=1 Tax=Olpidium bornovanus TaxID=278681 RepID=A0A8H7ZY54_9FUNG|nr:MAG: hypothetical protein BJ554DRAFT_6331 [Olpidium bornovanus]
MLQGAENKLKAYAFFPLPCRVGSQSTSDPRSLRCVVPPAREGVQLLRQSGEQQLQETENLAGMQTDRDAETFSLPAIITDHIRLLRERSRWWRRERLGPSVDRLERTGRPTGGPPSILMNRLVFRANFLNTGQIKLPKTPGANPRCAPPNQLPKQPKTR